MGDSVKLIICDELKINSYKLPNRVEDYYIINYYCEELSTTETIVLEASGDKWVINSDDTISVISNNTIVKSMNLEPYSSCQIRFGDFNKIINVIIIPSKFDYYTVAVNNSSSISIGNASSCNVIYNNEKIGFNQANIVFNGDKYVLKASDANDIKVYVNSCSVKEKELNLGDVIFIDGLKMIWLNDCIKINNPNGLVKLNGLNMVAKDANANKNACSPVKETEKNIKLYKENDVFFHTTRLKTKITNEIIEIELPPEADNEEHIPMILSIGSSAIIGITSCITGISAIHGLVTKQTDLFNAILEIVMCLLMLTACMFFPMLAESYQKKLKKKKEALRQKKYSEYLQDKVEKIKNIEQKQSNILRENNYTLEDINSRIMNNHNGVWQREIIDEDFLDVTLGIGDINAFIEIQAPTEQFSLYEDNLKEKVNKIVTEERLLKDVPINVSMINNRVLPFIINATFKDKYINSIMMQILFYYSGLDLKIVVLTNNANETKWEYIKYMPHCWANNRERRFFAIEENEMQQLSQYLEKVYDERAHVNKEDEDINKNSKSDSDLYKDYSPYYLIVTDDFKTIKNLSIIDRVIHSTKNVGFSLLVFDDSLKNLPSRVEQFVNIEESVGNLCTRDLEVKNQVTFKSSYIDVDMFQVMKILANIPLTSLSATGSLPTSLTFLEMFNAGKIEQLNVLNRWVENDPTTSLHTPVGMMANEKYLDLDLHEKYHGPHGLIAGTTGSGKSEFIITYILSLAINYHPYEVQFVLIDYKGGGLAGAFENRESGIKIPHLIGTITNLDVSEMHRTLVSIRSELQRRQIRFNEAREILNEGTIDIYKYQRLYREGKVKEPMSHLFVISDEFAELKDQQPDFMDELISTARIGRSLGIHLILATQKPSGVVNDQIWSNSRFKVCLKVQTTDDSYEMLKKSDAANIKEPGRFYLQVGNDEIFELGQSAWAGAKYVPVERMSRKIDDDIVFVDNDGSVIKKINEEVKTIDNVNHGEQLVNVVKYLSDIAIREKIAFRNLWLPALEEFISLGSLIKKYSQYKPVLYDIDVVIGEYDNPSSITQGLVKVDLTNENLLVIGIPGSGKENLLTTLVYSACIYHRPEEVNFYLLDFGAESLAAFKKMPHVGEVITIDNLGKIDSYFNFLEREIQKRKNLFADYSGSYVNYCENSGQKLPLIVTVLNSYESFIENCGDMEDRLIRILREGIKYGINIVTTVVAANSMRTTMLDCYQKKIMLQVADSFDYSYIMNAPRDLVPKKCYGRGIVGIGDDVCEFQVASVDTSENLNKTIKDRINYLTKCYQYKAKEIINLPSKVTVEAMIKECRDLRHVPLGYTRDDIELAYYDFLKNKTTLILGTDIINEATFMCGIIDLIDIFGKINLNIIDFLSCIETDGHAKYYSDNFDELFKYFLQNKEQNITINIILGIGNVETVLDEEQMKMFNVVMNNLDKINNNYFIIIDNYEEYKDIEGTEWFNKIDTNNGIWVGSDVKEQDIFKINNIDNIDEDIISTYIIENNNYIEIEGIGDENYESDDV